MRSWRRGAIAAIGLALAAVACTGTEEPQPHSAGTAVPTTAATTTTVATTTTAPLPERDPSVTPLLIKHGWDLPDADFVNINATTIDALGFDGIVFRIPSSSRVLSQNAISYEQFAEELAPVAGAALQTTTHNFVIIYNGPVGGFDAEAWVTPRANAANLARAAEEAGITGIFYDNENYDNKLRWNAEGNAEEVAALQCDATQRGTELMGALQSEWPTVTLLTLHGPGLSDERTAEVYDASFPYNDVAWANPLLGRFFMGMALAVRGTEATLIDGGEIYTMRNAEQYDVAYRWMLQGLPAESDLVPDELRDDYPDVVDAAFGVYDRTWEKVPMDPPIWRSTLIEALHRTDRYVWAYTERYDWLGTGHPSEPVPAEWVTATAEARAAAQSGR